MPPANAVDNAQTEAIFNSISDGIIACNGNGLITFANPAAKRLLNRDEGALVGLPINEAFKDFEPQGCQEVLDQLGSLQEQLENNQAGPDDRRHVILQMGQTMIDARLSVAFNAAQHATGVVAVLRDITKEFQTDKAKSEFVSMVSHELRTPMTSIKGYTTLLRQGMVGSLAAKQVQFLDIIQRNVDRLTTLINDLLDVSRIEAGKIRLDLGNTQLVELARHVVESMALQAANKGLDLRLDAPPDFPTIRADWRRITQVLTNLISNAIAYTQQGSVQVSLRVVSDTVRVKVQDTGIGMTPDEINAVFERFYRADNDVVRATGGTGLGLPIVKSFVEMHGGRIWVDSVPGKGSTFTFILPLDSE
ncbi:MAG: ATP-binding protein [Anaerolineae bacterium]